MKKDKEVDQKLKEIARNRSLPELPPISSLPLFKISKKQYNPGNIKP